MSRGRHGAWLHVDGAFGLWAAASGELQHHVRGIERADSCATDAHKWLNVPYDSGLVFVAHPAAHRAAMSLNAAYLVRSPDEPREPMDWTPDRRAARAASRSTRRCARSGAAASPTSSIAAAAWRGASPIAFAQEPAIRILNDVVLNQVLVRVVPPRAMPTRRHARRCGWCRRSASAGWAARAGTAWTRCASRSRTGRRPKRTSIGRPTRSCVVSAFRRTVSGPLKPVVHVVLGRTATRPVYS